MDEEYEGLRLTDGKTPGAPPTIERSTVMATCATCNETVDPATAEHKVEYRGTVYYFCCRHCLAAFEQGPERYVKA